MKTLRIVAFAILAICFFGSAEAQVVVRARIGGPPPHRGYYHRGPGYYHRGYYHHPYHHYYRHHPYRRY